MRSAPGSFKWRGAPTYLGAIPRQGPNLYREGPTRRDSASTLNPDTIQARQTKRGGAGYYYGRRLPKVWCHVRAARTWKPASPAVASAAPRTGPPALGRGLLLASCLDFGSHPLSARAPAQSPKGQPGLFPAASPRARTEGGTAADRSGPTFAGFRAGESRGGSGGAPGRN